MLAAAALAVALADLHEDVLAAVADLRSAAVADLKSAAVADLKT